MKRLRALGILIALMAGLIALRSTYPAMGASEHQALATSTVNPLTINPTVLQLPAWALPSGALAVDTVPLTATPCVPQLSPDLVDVFLLVHQDWCQGLQAVTGMFQDFRLDPSDPTPYVGEWAASVYPTAAQAQTAVQGITSFLRSQNEVDGTCAVAPNCILASYADVETMSNPDGTTSPVTTKNVVYAVWSAGNIVGEVAVEYEQAQSDNVAASYRGILTSNAAVVLGEILAGQPIAPPTPTPTSTPTSTATSLPTSISTGTAIATATVTLTATPRPSPTAHPTAVPFSFSLQSVKVAYGSANPAKAVTHASLTKLKVGQNVKLLAYVTYTGITSTMPVRFTIRVSRAGKTTYFMHLNSTISAADNGGFNYYGVTYHPTQAGQYTYAGTMYIGAHHQHKAVTFVAQ